MVVPLPDFVGTGDVRPVNTGAGKSIPVTTNSNTSPDGVSKGEKGEVRFIPQLDLLDVDVYINTDGEKAWTLLGTIGDGW